MENGRGQGLLIAVDLLHTKGSDLVNRCQQDGLLINAPRDSSIRLMPPLVVKEKEVEKLIFLLKSNLKKRKIA